MGNELRSIGTIKSALSLVSTLASLKSVPVVEAVQGDGIVVTCDQVVTHPTMGILEKPVDLDEARTFMDGYRDVPKVTTVGSVRCTHVETGLATVETFTATVTFDPVLLRRDEEERLAGKGKGILEELVESNAPVLKCAGGLMIENPIVKKFIVDTVGGEDAVLGLSRRSTVKALKELNEKIRTWKEEWE